MRKANISAPPKVAASGSQKRKKKRAKDAKAKKLKEQAESYFGKVSNQMKKSEKAPGGCSETPRTDRQFAPTPAGGHNGDNGLDEAAPTPAEGHIGDLVGGEAAPTPAEGHSGDLVGGEAAPTPAEGHSGDLVGGEAAPTPAEGHSGDLVDGEAAPTPADGHSGDNGRDGAAPTPADGHIGEHGLDGAAPTTAEGHSVDNVREEMSTAPMEAASRMEVDEGGLTSSQNIRSDVSNADSNNQNADPTLENENSETVSNTDGQFDIGSTSDLTKIKLSDPTTWPKVLYGGLKRQLAESTFDVDECKRGFQPIKGHRFLARYFYGRKANNEEYFRDWLRYSFSTNSAFCLPCCLFLKRGRNIPNWAKYGAGCIGFQNFHNALKGVRTHEESKSHKVCVRDWRSFLNSTSDPTSLASRTTSHENVDHWRLILKALLDAIMFLAKNNLAFQGKSHNIADQNSGNFLNLVKLLSRYHAPLCQHVENLKKKSPSYLSPQSQNEFILLCGNAVRSTILKRIRKSKYYSIILDGTPDFSHQDQVSQIIRSVACSQSGCVINENFIDFIATNDKTGLGLFNTIMEKLKGDNLDTADCKGQGYDNGANMAGCYSGVQARVKEVIPDAKFLPCLAHSLNLVGSNCAEKIAPGRLILGTIQNLYQFFSGSTSRWAVLKSKTKITLKCQSSTRWSSKADAVKAVSSQLISICEALNEIAESDKFSADVTTSASSRIRDIWNFKFLLGTTIWSKVLTQINLCNKRLQEKSTDVCIAARHLNVLLSWIEEFSISGFLACQLEAEAIAETAGIDLSTGFENVRRGRGVHRRFMDPNEYQIVQQQSNLERFKTDFFDTLMLKLVDEMKRRFAAVNECATDFSFLWGTGLQGSPNSELAEKAKVLALKYSRDLDVEAFQNEVETLRLTVKEFKDLKMQMSDLTALDVLNVIYKNNLESTYCNCEIALRIFLTLPVSVASAERSFSKLKLIKNYLRSCMGQERLNGLAILSIEREEANKIDFDSVINTFINVKCRKIAVY